LFPPNGIDLKYFGRPARILFIMNRLRQVGSSCYVVSICDWFDRTGHDDIVCAVIVTSLLKHLVGVAVRAESCSWAVTARPSEVRSCWRGRCIKANTAYCSIKLQQRVA